MNSTTDSSEILASINSLKEQMNQLSQSMQFVLTEPSNIINQQISHFANDISGIVSSSTNNAIQNINLSLSAIQEICALTQQINQAFLSFSKPQIENIFKDLSDLELLNALKNLKDAPAKQENQQSQLHYVSAEFIGLVNVEAASPIDIINNKISNFSIDTYNTIQTLTSGTYKTIYEYPAVVATILSGNINATPIPEVKSLCWFLLTTLVPLIIYLKTNEKSNYL